MDRRLQGLLLFFFVLVSISRCVFSRGAGISLGSPRRANVVGGLVAEHDDGHPAESSSAEREIDGSFAKLTGRGGGGVCVCVCVCVCVRAGKTGEAIHDYCYATPTIEIV